MNKIGGLRRVWIFGCCLLLAQTAGLKAADLVLQRVALASQLSPPSPENVGLRPVMEVEVLSQSDSTADLELSSKSETPDTSDTTTPGDSNAGYLVSYGSTTVLASLPKTEIIEGIGFRNNGAQGKVLVSIANARFPAAGPQWRPTMKQDLTPGMDKIKVGPMEAKYIKLTFIVTKAGRVGDVGVYSTPLVSNLTRASVASYDFGDVCSGAHAIYVSSGESVNLANKMIDGQAATCYRFAANDIRPVAIIDLGDGTTLGRISSIYSPTNGSVDFYVLKTLPRDVTSISSDGADTLHLSETALSQLKPIGSAVDDSTGRAAINFPATTGRYIMLKWNPATQQGTSFRVAEIAAFRSSGTQSTSLRVANVGLDGADGKDISEGKDKDVTMDVKDFKACCNEPESPAEGPPPDAEPPSSIITIPVVSP